MKMNTSLPTERYDAVIRYFDPARMGISPGAGGLVWFHWWPQGGSDYHAASVPVPLQEAREMSLEALIHRIETEIAVQMVVGCCQDWRA